MDESRTPSAFTAETTLRRVVSAFGLRLGVLFVGLLFALIVPRLAGPTLYGRFALLSSVTMWFVLISDLGLTSVILRRLPRSIALDDDSQTAARILFTRFLVGRVLFCLAVILLLQPLAHRLIPQLTQGSLPLFAAYAVLCVASETIYAFCLALNRADRWSSGYLLRRSLQLILIVLLLFPFGLRGMAAGLLLSEFVVLLRGLGWTRTYWSFKSLRQSSHILSGLPRAAFMFCAASLCIATSRHGGEALMRSCSADFPSIALFAVGMSIYSAAEASLQQLFRSLVPYVTHALIRREDSPIAHGLRVLTGLLSALASWIFLILLFGGRHLIPCLLGNAYAGVTPVIILFGALGVVIIPALAGSAMAISREKPGLYLAAAAMRLILFAGCLPPLTARAGAVGAGLAALIGGIGQAAVFLIAARREPLYPYRSVLLNTLLLIPAASLVLLRQNVVVDSILLSVVLLTHVLLALRFGIVDLMTIRSALTPLTHADPDR